MTKKEWKRIMFSRINAGTCVCYLCGERIMKQKDLSLEHAFPRSRFPEMDTETNWYPAHKNPCNSEKGALTFDEYQVWKKLNNIRIGLSKQR